MLLALDVGFANMGWALMENGEPQKFGVITTEKTKKKQVRVADDNAHRAAEMAGGLAALISSHKIGGVVGELPHGGAQNAKAMAQMAAASAIAAAVCELLRVPVEWSTPDEGKKALTGKKAASKDEMMDAVRGMYPDIVFPTAKSTFEHIADAIASYHASKHGNLVRMFG